jgi:hypothetical protein
VFKIIMTTSKSNLIYSLRKYESVISVRMSIESLSALRSLINKIVPFSMYSLITWCLIAMCFDR